jgi:hypothetical protein
MKTSTITTICGTTPCCAGGQAYRQTVGLRGCQDGLHRTQEPVGENGYIESFNARLRDELLDGEIFR